MTQQRPIWLPDMTQKRVGRIDMHACSAGPEGRLACGEPSFTPTEHNHTCGELENKRTAGGSAHVTTNTGVSKGSAAESGRMGGLKVARGEPGPRGAVVVAARGAVVGGASQAATHRAGSTAMVGGAGACPSFPFLSRQLPPICSRKRGSPASLLGSSVLSSLTLTRALSRLQVVRQQSPRGRRSCGRCVRALGAATTSRCYP